MTIKAIMEYCTNPEKYKVYVFSLSANAHLWIGEWNERPDNIEDEEIISFETGIHEMTFNVD